MKNFILGILFIYLGVPIIENFTSWLESKTSLSIQLIAKKIYDIQQTMKDDEGVINNPLGFQTQNTDCIGFEIQSDDNEYEE